MNCFQDAKGGFGHGVPVAHYVEALHCPFEVLECIIQVFSVLEGMEDVDCCNEDDGVEGIEYKREHFVMRRSEEIEEGSLGTEDVEASFQS